MFCFGYLYLLFFPFVGFFYSLFGLWKNPLKWRRYLPLFVYFLLIGAYAWEPPSYQINFDLIRYIPEIEKYGGLSLQEAFSKYNDILYARDFLFWIFGSLKIPHMVPAVTTATVYAISFYITCDTAERYNKENYIGFLLLFRQQNQRGVPL